MGDGGFWHNGLLTGVASAVHNDLDGVLLILDNGYTASTGGQFLPSTAGTTPHKRGTMSIEAAARALGAPWVKTVRSYSVPKVIKLLREAMTMPQRGLKVIVARGECQLQKEQRTYAACFGRNTLPREPPVVTQDSPALGSHGLNAGAALATHRVEQDRVGAVDGHARASE